jgi:intraflagellar transport protein 172
MLSVTAATWKPDGSRLAVGGLRGNVDLWDTCIRRTKCGGAAGAERPPRA